MLVRALLALAAALAAASLAAAPAAHAIEPVALADGRLLDERGREVVLHGINVHYKVAPFLPHDGGGVRTSFTEQEAARLREWGWNTVRLAWSMEGLMPERGKIDQDYLRRYVEMVRMAGRHGQYVLVDFHQDEFSPKYKGNGFPAWAADDDGIPFPPQSTGHPNDYGQPAVGRAFWNFFHDEGGVRTEFVRAWAALARALRDEPAVLGYDMFNEPSCEMNREGYFKPAEMLTNEPRAAGVCLQPLYDQLVPALREADPNHPVFYEDFFNSAWGFVPYGVGEPPNKPWPFDDTGLSFHVYCPHPLHSERSCDSLEREAFDRALANAKRNRAWPLLSEFGAVDDLAPIERALENADRLGISWQFWSLKTWDDPHPGFGPDSLNPNADGFSLVAKDGKVKEGKLKLLARVYPERVAGRDARWDFDPGTREFEMSWTPSGRAATVLSVPLPVHYRDGYRVAAEGAKVVSRPGAPLVELRALRGAKRAAVTLRPGAGPAQAPPARCARRRSVVVRVGERGRTRLRSVRVTIGGRRVPARRLGGRRVRVDLRGTRAARVRMKVTGRTTTGRRVSAVRAVRTCH